MSNVTIFVIALGLLAPAYGVYAIRSVMAAPAGTERMEEIAAAIQEGVDTIGWPGVIKSVLVQAVLEVPGR